MKKLAILLFAAATLGSCQKFLDVEPEGVILESEALQNPEDVQRLLNSAYDVTANYFNGRIQNLSELLGDNLATPLNNNDYQEVYNRNVLFFNGTVGGVYADPYIAIFRANLLIEKAGEVPGMDANTLTRTLAEAKFLRALGHFSLVTLWGQPYGYTSDNSHAGVVLKTNTEVGLLPRSSVGAVYVEIIADLQDAIQNLPDVNGPYATSWAAKALLARVYFQQNQYANAANMASDVIDNGPFQLDTNIDRFVESSQGIASPEAIFYTVSYNNGSQQDIRSGGFTGNYRSDNNPNPTLRAANEFYTTYAADTADKRIKAFFEVKNQGAENEFVAVTKFNKNYFNVPILHVTELKLMRAECYAINNVNLSVAIQDINDIRDRAYGVGVNALPPTATAQDIEAAALYERRIELFAEGNRTQDLKRLGAFGQPIVIRGADWNCDGMVLQFPINEKSAVFELNPQGGCN